MKYFAMHPEQIVQSLQTDMEKGLDEKEAKRRLKQFGYNELQEREKPSHVLLFFSQFKDFMVIVLLIATLISGLLGEWIDGIAIIAIVFINGILGFFQEYKAEKSLDALKSYTAPVVSVLRNSNWMKIPAKEIVPGDIMKFSAGDRIGADVRLIEANSLEIEESALTGESLPSSKDVNPVYDSNAGLGDLSNMAFMGSLVTRGSGKGIVVGTGMKTAVGKIADLLQTTPMVMTPLQRRLEQLGKILITAALLLTFVVVFAGIIQGRDMYTMFLSGVSLAVAAIPEGLPAIVTIALSLGVQRMIKKNAIVKKLPAVETLGCATVICSDKTGTMTQNKMTVTKLYTNEKMFTVTGEGYNPIGSFFFNNRKIDPINDEHIKKMLQIGMLCNHAQIVRKKGKFILDGDPTEGALIVAAMKAGLSKERLLKDYRVIQEFPFDSRRKMMTMIIENDRKERWAITKGAPDVLMKLSTTVLLNGRRERMTSRTEKKLKLEVEKMAEEALRTIAIAYKRINGYGPFDQSAVEKDLIFLGFYGMIDPPRKEVKEAIEKCKRAGIKTVMITGDHMTTARAIGTQLGIYGKQSQTIDGGQLEKMTVEELEEVVERVSIFARVSPEHKLKIVQALQNKGHIVAMTGDGVNDAPAIKAADIGISMGITGTEVAKEASALVLLDDNFKTIKDAIEEGRNIYENIRKFIRYLLASNVGEILVMLFAILLALPLPLVPVQILWVNLVTDGLPAIALGLDKPEENVMLRKPRHPKEGVFARGLGWKIISRGFLIGLVTLLAFIFVYKQYPNNLPYAQTVAFATLVLAQLIHVFDCRSEQSIFSRNPFENLYLVGAVLSSIILMLVVIYIPTFQPIFHTVPILLKDWLLILGMACIPTFLLAGSFYIRKT
ncbi:calcium-translocating P-type ATPase, SERCA-type [Fervidibacillus halotolerans]|uniref:Calcium-translocating P-type ATPase, SERCA-type n=1 Tax=Fervidibacillus halotolerans TaxID=2980027 RepID=A0A9E8M307_9BACI|nr:calcium-translocating P-type ATPase, SERCA-type [Fervidibacillus halotolerans]WAA13661.1 calcium-translocating P-type ATPase, SERCA-type [Fervidibacillus halotolerans]